MYHITTLAVAGWPLFADPVDYHTRLAILANAVEQKRLAIHVACLMGNHEHLLVTVENDQQLGNTMQRMNRAYAGAFNKRHSRIGRVYGKPYGNEPVLDERHAFFVVAYIALNSEKAGLGPAETYVYSSYPSLIGLREPWPFIDDTPIVDLFGGGDLGRQRIAEYVAEVRAWRRGRRAA